MSGWLQGLVLAAVLSVRITGTGVELTWNAVPSADHYEIARNSAGGTFATLGTSETNTFTDATPAANTSYLYRVRPIDALGTPGGWSDVALADTAVFTDDPLIERLTPVKAAHVTQLRTTVNRVRVLAGLAPATFAHTPAVRAAHVTDLRTALDSARSALGQPPLAYQRTLTPQTSIIRAGDFTELRDGVTGRTSFLDESLFWSRVPGRSNVHALTGMQAQVFAAGGQLHKSDDHGEAWTTTTLPYPNAMALAHLAEGGIVAGFSGGQVSRYSEPGGWATLANMPAAVTALLAAPEGLYVGLTCNGVRFRDRRTGVWSTRSTGLGACVTALARDASGRLFAGTSDAGIFRSTDFGGSWSPSGSGLTATEIHAVAVEGDQDVFAASHTAGIFRSTDHGATWEAVHAFDARALHVDSTGALLAGAHANGTIALSIDGGATWTAASDGLPGLGTIEALASTTRFRFAVNDGLLYRAPVGFRLYGINFGPYVDGQNPNTGAVVSPQQLYARMSIIRPYTRWIRTFGSTGGLEKSGRIAHALGLKAAVGAWIGSNAAANQRELDNLVAVARAGDADLLIVGSEVLLRGDVTPQTLLGYVDSVRQRAPGVPIAVADTYGALLANPDVIAAADVILGNFYPFWENVPLEQAIPSLDAAYRDLVEAADGKPVIVSETGWPSDGAANATPANAARYFLDFVSWARANEVDSFYFEAFDEAWKSLPPGQPVEAHWGIWDSAGNLKAGMEDVLRGDTAPIPGGPGEPSIAFTYVPPYGTFEDLRGQALHVEPGLHRVAVYIYVSGWWTKPFFGLGKTVIGSDGSWICDVTTGGSDQNATKMAAFLIPSSYEPPQLSGHAAFPQELHDNALASVEVMRPPP